jgi:hypothetical protein
MKEQYLFPISLLFLISFSSIITGCSDKNDKNDSFQDPEATWDIEKDGIPKFIGANYIELDKIFQISKYRSSFGHDYSDGFEQCRSMKHYFEPRNDVDWSTIKIYSPVNGKIVFLEQEWAGLKIEMTCNEYPAFRICIFHVNPLVPINLGDTVFIGEQLGTHIGSQTMSDIAVFANDPAHRRRMVSYFEVITDDVFDEYVTKGVNTRQSMIISKEERDANPLTCNGETFTSFDPLTNWVILQQN